MRYEVFEMACLPGVSQSKLKPESARRLYGQHITLSPSRVDKYYSCPYQHFMHSGLKLKPRVPAAFDAPMAGTFMHFVLEGISREIKETIGFNHVDDTSCKALAAKYIDEYISKYLFGFEGRNARFIYLFRRLEEDVIRILTDMIEELKLSDFVPLDFELDFSELLKNQKCGVHTAQGFDLSSLRGIVDRVDGWTHGDKLYLRVIDYKTGKKVFSLSDVMYGRDMQMLIYLFALQKYGALRYDAPIAPGGVLYVPARDVIIKSHRDASEEEISRARKKALRRGGLLLNDPLIIEAMELGEDKQYLPVKLSKDNEFKGDSLVSPEQIALIERHVAKMLGNAAMEILSGAIACQPMFKSESDNACLYCDFHMVCAFDEAAGGKRKFVRKMKTAEIWEILQRDATDEDQ